MRSCATYPRCQPEKTLRSSTHSLTSPGRARPWSVAPKLTPHHPPPNHHPPPSYAQPDYHPFLRNIQNPCRSFSTTNPLPRRKPPPQPPPSTPPHPSLVDQLVLRYRGKTRPSPRPSLQHS